MGGALRPLTGVLIRATCEDTEMHRGKAVRRWTQIEVMASRSQGTPRDAQSPQKPAEAGGTLPGGLRRECSPAVTSSPDSASRTARGEISVVLRPQLAMICYGSPGGN